MTLRPLGRRLMPILALVFAASFAAAQGSGDRRRTGYQDMSAALQQMQDDDTSNPGMLFVQAGGLLWKEPAGRANKACADCHAGGETAMKGVAARYPAFPRVPTTPSRGRINLCRTGW